MYDETQALSVQFNQPMQNISVAFRSGQAPYPPSSAQPTVGVIAIVQISLDGASISYK